VRDNGMLVQTLRAPQEVRGQAAYFEGIPADGADKDMLDLAMKLIEQKSTDFKPEDYKDRYEEALLALVKAKIAGEEPVVAAAPARGNVINLMDALKKSLEGEKPPAGSKARSSKAPPKKKPAPKRKSA
jgi:DNA end-binding protein Ku